MANIFRGPSFAPQLKRPFVGTDVVQNVLLTTLVVVATLPFIAREEQPAFTRAKQITQDFYHSGVLTRGFPAAAALPFAKEVQPQVYRRRDIPTDLFVSGVTTRGIPPTVVANKIFRQPTVAPLFKRNAASVNEVPNLLQTTLKATGATAPFHQNDWANPIGRSLSLGYQAISTVSYADVTTAPFFQSEWPTPARIKALPVFDITLNTTLTGIPQRIGFNNYDWPLTLRAKAPPQSDSLSGVATRGIVPPPPLKPTDFTATQIARRFIQVDDPPNVIIQSLLVAAPFSQKDWPTPSRAKPTWYDDSQSGVTTRGITPPPPLTPFDWQNPLAKKPIRFDDPPNTAIKSLIVNAPFSQLDWVTPTRVRPLAQAESHSGVLTRGIPQPLPNNQYEWPTPSSARAIAFDAPPNVAINAPVVAKAPFFQTEWPNPVRARHTPQADSRNNRLLNGIPQIMPFVQSDWPLVSTRPRAIPVADSQPTVWMPLPPAPFYQNEWITPAKARQPIQPEQPINTVAFKVDRLPIRLSDWPNPFTRKPGWDIYFQWTNSQVITTAAPVIVIPPAGGIFKEGITAVAPRPDIHVSAVPRLTINIKVGPQDG